MAEDVRAGVAQIIAEQAMVDVDVIKDETTMEHLGLDSLALVEVVFGIEEKFDISVPYNANDPTESDFELTNFKAVVSAVERLVAEKETS